MPPAFVLSQDQTLKFDVQLMARRNIPRQKLPFLGADTCTILTWCVGHCEIGLALTDFRNLEASGAGAAAHMSLHHTDNVKEPANSTKQIPCPAISTGGRSILLCRRPITAKTARHHRVGERPYMPRPHDRQTLFALLLRKTGNSPSTFPK